MTTKIAGNVLTIAGLGELTAANAGRFQKEVCAALNGHPVVEVDLSQTTAMDCTGLGALIAVRNLAHRQQGCVRLLGAMPAVQRLFDVVRAGELFEIANVKEQEEHTYAGVSAYSVSDSFALAATF